MAPTLDLPRMGYFRNMDDTEHHLANDWTSMSMCGSWPRMRQVGWMFGIPYGSFVGGDIQTCAECQSEYRQFANDLAAISARR